MNAQIILCEIENFQSFFLQKLILQMILLLDVPITRLYINKYFLNFVVLKIIKFINFLGSPVPVPTRRSVSPSSPLSPYGSPALQSWGREIGGEEMAQSSSSLSPSPLNNSNVFTNSEQRYSPPSPIEEVNFILYLLTNFMYYFSKHIFYRFGARVADV